MSRRSAADRTIDIFAQAAMSKVEDASTEDTVDRSKPGESIEEASERWRATAFYGLELVSKHFNDEEKPDIATFRLTVKPDSKGKEWMFLEQFRNSNGSKAYHWSGVMFPYSDLYELAGVVVKAAKEKQSRETK